MKTAEFLPYEEVPVSDSTWALHAAADGRVYAAVCIETRGGAAAFLARVSGRGRGYEYLVDFGEATGDPPDSGRPTQCKVHYGFVSSARDGILYAATHASAPAAGEFHFDVAADFADPRDGFRGSVLVAYDTRRDRVLWAREFIPREGCRCLAYDDERRRLYAVGWPRNHFLAYDLETGRTRDYGRLGALNPQAIWFDARRRAYTTDDGGRILRFDPAKDSLEELDLYVPRAGYQSGWCKIVYDIVAAPDGETLYGVPLTSQPHLFRHRPLDGPEGALDDLGPASQAERDLFHPMDVHRDHVGGLVFGLDGKLYYGVSRWRPGDESRDDDSNAPLRRRAFRGFLVRLDVETLEREDVAELIRPDGKAAHYITRGVRDASGDLYFGTAGASPSGLFRLAAPGGGGGAGGRGGRGRPAPLRMWG